MSPIPSYKNDPGYRLELIFSAFGRHKITFSKTAASKLVGGEYRLEKLIRNGEIRADKPTAKQNGKWFCNGADVLRHIKL